MGSYVDLNDQSNAGFKLDRFARRNTIGYIELDSRIREQNQEIFDSSIDAFISHAQQKTTQHYVREVTIK